MDKAMFDKGLEIRRAVLGNEYVDAQLKGVDDFNRPQELVTEYCWGAVWGRPGLPRNTRSMLNLAMISILNRPHELRDVGAPQTIDQIHTVLTQLTAVMVRPLSDDWLTTACWPGSHSTVVWRFADVVSSAAAVD